ncbi:hypothetical protein [Mesorhizobium sp. STM 4661]|uniref:hypothetical protein n=1 Tax=Mesorhizobium sp. STM 4661 TaxID=1297570 RepID=UPI0002BF8A91|nr:hypothetical protein [Mesorhizobium sp. STM 4661]CCV13984.1 hypothetical protein MESS4_620028 [Mesorhizobium sp. STM 4661]
MTNLPTRLSEHLSLGRLPLCVLKSQELLVLGAGIQSAVEQLSSQPDTACSFGVDGRQGSKRVSLAELLAPGADEWWAGPIEFKRLADDHAAPLSYPTNGLFLFTVETEPVALLVRHDDDEHPFLLRLEIACRSVDHADRILAQLMNASRERLRSSPCAMSITPGPSKGFISRVVSSPVSDPEQHFLSADLTERLRDFVAPEPQPAEPPRCATPSSLDGSDQLTDLRGSILHADKGSIFNAV